MTDYLATQQRADGSWTAFLQCGMLNFFYASTHALLGRPADAPVIRDMCLFAEACANADGSIGLAPGQPGDVLSTYSALLVLRWAKPGSRAIERAEAWLKRSPMAPPRVPLLMLAEHSFGRALGPDAASYGPPDPLRRAGIRIWRALMTRLSFSQFFANPALRNARLPALVLDRMINWSFWPSESNPEELPEYFPPYLVLDIAAPTLAIRRIAGVRPESRLDRFGQAYMDDYLYDDGTLLYIKYAPAYVACAKFTGDEARLELLQRGFDALEYREGGWLRGATVSINIFDTALTLSALARSGARCGSGVMERAVAFLRDAQGNDGSWAWSYAPGMGPRRRVGDSDDTSAAISALLDAGVSSDDPAIRRGVAALRRMQAPSGGYFTFDVGDAVNVISVSNTSRAIMALLRAGVPRHDPAIARACAWLRSEQESNGRWVDFWVARWIYGTAMAVEALTEAGESADSPTLSKARKWLYTRQNADGGWGETWYGEPSSSTVEHTAMASNALQLLGQDGDSAVARGLSWLLRHQRADGGFTPSYVGGYSHFEGYKTEQIALYWPLRALGHASKTVRAPLSAQAPVSYGAREMQP